MITTTIIPASQAKARFSELLNRIKKGEAFSITLHGQEVARLTPARERNEAEIANAVAMLKASRLELNPKGFKKITHEDLIEEGRRY